MNLKLTYALQPKRPGVKRTPGRFASQAIRLGAILFFATAAFAQYGGTGTGAPGSTSTTPSYGHGKAIGIGVGAAAAGAGAVYLLTHRASKVSGCVETADDGLHLTEDKTNRSLTLVPGSANLKPGDRVELKGKLKKSPSGDQSFLVKAVSKDLGPCHTQAAGAP